MSTKQINSESMKDCNMIANLPHNHVFRFVMTGTDSLVNLQCIHPHLSGAHFRCSYLESLLVCCTVSLAPARYTGQYEINFSISFLICLPWGSLPVESRFHKDLPIYVHRDLCSQSFLFHSINGPSGSTVSNKRF